MMGRDNSMPWHLPADLQFFKRITLNKPIVMGRKTHESIGRVLPGRTNIVVTRDPRYQAEGCVVVHSLDDALRMANDVEEVMLIGGGELFSQALPLAERIYLTRVNAEVEGDVHFPELDPEAWREVWREEHPADARNRYAHTRMLLERIIPAKPQQAL
ncbi:MAG: type 3 dihydrofolate reductase [Gammaproteobacteria bacterium]